jgi:hypothetical protein
MPMNKSKFKYNINHYISLLPREISIGNIEEVLLKSHGITRDAFYRDRNILISEPSSIPTDRLDAYAILFGCSTDELKNYKPKGKSLIEILYKSKTGLK